MKKQCFTTWLSFLLFPIALSALPQGEQTISGTADFCQKNESLAITTSNKAIISYDSFNVSAREHVRFIQPAKDSSVLNRIDGPSPSQILGNITSNGKVFLVNPHGVYFGPDASVNTGSLIVSTLDISDHDFLQDRFHFCSRDKNISKLIHNEGELSSPGGIIALISHQIKNEGVIAAIEGNVLLTTAASVTIDFSGDGLMSFVLEGKIKDAVVGHLDETQSPSKQIFINLKTAQHAIANVINTDSLVEGNSLSQENGVIRIMNQSSIIADGILIAGTESSKISIEGTLNASSYSPQKTGGNIQVLGDHIELKGATIDASGDKGGGTVLIGGDYKGEGLIKTAITNTMDQSSTIEASAITEGNGGKVILWADRSTLFNGKILVKGGQVSGNGGFVETSGKRSLVLQTGFVDTTSPYGSSGVWLLDPDTIAITSSGGTTLTGIDTCTDTSTAFTVTAATINAAGAHVILCADTSITQDADQPISMSGTHSITFKGNSPISTTLNANITTKGGSVTFTNSSVTLGADVTIDTTNTNANGANINFSGLTGSIDGTFDLTLNAGTGGTIILGGIVGGATALGDVTVTSARNLIVSYEFTGSSFVQSAGTGITKIVNSMNTSGATGVSITGTVVDITGAVTTTSAGPFTIVNSGLLNISNNIYSDGPVSQSGGGKVILGATIQTTNETAGSASVSFTNPIILSAATSINTETGGGTITFGSLSTINGLANLSLLGGAGNITLSGVIGKTNPIRAFTIYSAGDLSLPVITATSLRQVSGIGTTTVTGLITTTGEAGVLLLGSIITVNASINALGKGPVLFQNSGLLTIISSATITAAGSFRQIGPGSASIAGSITSR